MYTFIKGFWSVLACVSVLPSVTVLIRECELSRLNTRRLSGQLFSLSWLTATSSAAPGGLLAAPVGISTGTSLGWGSLQGLEGAS